MVDSEAFEEYKAHLERIGFPVAKKYDWLLAQEFFTECLEQAGISATVEVIGPSFSRFGRHLRVFPDDGWDKYTLECDLLGMEYVVTHDNRYHEYGKPFGDLTYYRRIGSIKEAAEFIVRHLWTIWFEEPFCPTALYREEFHAVEGFAPVWRQAAEGFWHEQIGTEGPYPF